MLSRKSRTEGVSDPAKLLITEHEKVERLFAELAKRTGAVERQGLIAQLDGELSAHTAKEEAILYPFIRSRVPGGDRMVQNANHEHGLAKQSLADLVSMDPGDERVTAVAAELERLVSHHVKEEEKKIFPALAKAAPADDLAQLRGDLEAAKFSPVEHPLETPAAPAKKRTAKKAAAKKRATAKRAAPKRATAKKAAAKRAATKKTAVKKVAATRKSTARKAVAKKSTARKAVAKRAPARKARPAKKAAAKKRSR